MKLHYYVRKYGQINMAYVPDLQTEQTRLLKIWRVFRRNENKS